MYLSTTVEILMWFETKLDSFLTCLSTTVEILMWFETCNSGDQGFYLQQ